MRSALGILTDAVVMLFIAYVFVVLTLTGMAGQP
jgi:hypothetical protein